MDELVFEDNRKKTLLTIGENRYEITLIVSVGDILLFGRETEAGNSDYKRIFCEMIRRKMPEDDRADIEIVVAAVERTKEEIIEGFLENQNRIKEEYAKMDDMDNPYERFVRATLAYHRIEWTKLQANLPKIDVTPIVQNIGQSIAPITGFLQNVSFISKEISESIKRIQEAFITPFQEQMKAIRKSYEEILKPFAENIRQIVSSIQLTNYTDEEKEAILNSYKRWGEFGWTMIPSSPYRFFHECPDSWQEANAMALKYCKDKDMQDLFERMRQEKTIKQSDLEEAIFCFQNKKWKACVLILFGLVDAKLIRMQKPEDLNPKARNPRRASGSSAAKNLLTRLQKENDLEKILFLWCRCQNILSCCQKLFEQGNDFKEQPTIINRNFVNHGMLTRPVMRKDCVQLFLLYYNLIEFIEIIRI